MLKLLRKFTYRFPPNIWVNDKMCYPHCKPIKCFMQKPEWIKPRIPMLTWVCCKCTCDCGHIKN